MLLQGQPSPSGACAAEEKGLQGIKNCQQRKVGWDGVGWDGMGFTVGIVFANNEDPHIIYHLLLILAKWPCIFCFSYYMYSLYDQIER